MSKRIFPLIIISPLAICFSDDKNTTLDFPADSAAQPTLNAVYGDLHASTWKVIFRENVTGPYDPNWFSYGPDNSGAIVFNTDTPHVGMDVHTGFDTY